MFRLGGGSEPPRVLFTYWGRRGLTRFVLDVAHSALASPSLKASISVSRQNESFAAFAELGDAVVPVDTFDCNAGALLQAWRIPIIRKRLMQHITLHKPEVVIELMPHVWSSFVAPAIMAMGVRYVTIIHDATTHPGDYRSRSIAWLSSRTLRQADIILTLSSTVANHVKAASRAPHKRIFALFHPDLNFGGRRSLPAPQAGQPMRLIFFGRIMPYKGLPLFLDMVDELRNQGISVEVGVFGEGSLGASAARLSAMRAEVVNRWLTETEITEVLPRFHAVVLSHVEASQSGVAAAALGAGLPVIATPVGGIVEQVVDEVTGVLAARADAIALAEAAKRLLLDTQLYQKIGRDIEARKGERSVARFVEALLNHAIYFAEPAPGVD